MNIRLKALLLLLLTGSLCHAHVGSEIEAAMGGRTKLVWLRAVDWAEVRVAPGQPWKMNTDRYQCSLNQEKAEKEGILEPAASVDGGARDEYIIRVGHIADTEGAYALYALDSADGKEREVVPRGILYNPLISPDGGRIIYTAGDKGPRRSAFRSATKRIRVVDWDGANDRELVRGEALWVWRDPQTGKDWVYLTVDHKSIARVPLDGEPKIEPVAKVAVAGRFSLSADGLRAGGEFPWPKAGILDLTTGEVMRDGFRNGCNTYLAPDNSYRLMVMSGSHRDVTIYTPGGASRELRVVPPGMKSLSTGKSGVVWNPKWTSNARGLTVNGPVRNLGSDVSDIWLAGFSDDGAKIEKWIQVTNNPYCDTYGYAWVAPGQSNTAIAAKPVARPTTLPVGAQPAVNRAKIKATLLTKSDLPSAKAMAPYRNALVVYEYRVDEVLEGKCDEKTVRVAQWGMKDLQPTPLAASTIGTTTTFAIESYNAHPKLKSEFMNDTLPEDFDKPLFVQME